MTVLFLSESPIHLLDQIKINIDQDEIDEELALATMNVFALINKMKTFTDDAIKRIAGSDAMTTLKACASIQANTSDNVINKFISDFNKDNKQRILNDIKLYQARLLKIYQDAGVDVHKDT